ncbi:MAG: threonylcarbamoyl-AMP synthase [Acetobacteraceae bacterium]|nr:threonylcarbamoyl-AMP synthase [Acetobacteraceae bacterium]
MTRQVAADDAGIAEAARLLRAGALVAFPTETVYGLGADATSEAAVEAIFRAKGRPHFNPLICHYCSADEAGEDVVLGGLARRLAEHFWPGPLTLVLARRPASRIRQLAGAGLSTLAVRVPAHPVSLALLRAVALPIAAPSANRSGQVSPTTAQHVLDGLSGRIALVLDGGPTEVGLESTVLDLTGEPAVLLRPGGVPLEAIEAVIGSVRRPLPIGLAGNGRPTLQSPGLLVSHYAPELPVRLDARMAGADEALLAFGPAPPGAGLVFQLSGRRDLGEAASRLFGGLRTLDAEGRRLGLRRIAAMTVPEHGLGLAINDRLRRAAAPRG